MFKRIIPLIPFLLVTLFCVNTASAETIDYFYGIGCPHCAEITPIIDEFAENNPNHTVNKHEVYQNRENAKLLLEKYKTYQVPQNKQGVPSMFTNGNYYIGAPNIINALNNFNPNETAKNPPETNTNPDTVTKISLWAIAGAAIVDSINPCAIAVLLILLGALLLSTENKKRALQGGLAFTFSIYISYFLFGLGILQALTFFNTAGWIHIGIGILALLIGLLNIKDFFFYGKFGVTEIPRSWRPKLKKMLKSITSPLGAFLIGFVVMLFELPCTGGPYFFVLGLLSTSASWSTIIPVLAFYNLVFVLPLLTITFLVYFGYASIDKATKWKDDNIRVLHLIAGLIMLALGIWVILM
ncbi:hypothetical protein GF340_05365 [Candidatus Peregrinibacteria bacterium]|nr:hypothetical protein [Candidatus Peregrinibacteria bacterium]